MNTPFNFVSIISERLNASIQTINIILTNSKMSQVLIFKSAFGHFSICFTQNSIEIRYSDTIEFLINSISFGANILKSQQGYILG